jgi:hypothetical protein
MYMQKYIVSWSYKPSLNMKFSYASYTHGLKEILYSIFSTLTTYIFSAELVYLIVTRGQI